MVFSFGIEGQESKPLVTVCLHQKGLKGVFIFISELKTKSNWNYYTLLELKLNDFLGVADGLSEVIVTV